MERNSNLLIAAGIKCIDYPESKVLEHHEPDELAEILQLELPEESPGKAAILTLLTNTLKYSANTWHQGFKTYVLYLIDLKIHG